MIQFIENLNKESKVYIDGNEYRPIAKASYVTADNPECWYVKIFFENHFVLVMSPHDDFIYFGKDVGSIGIEFPTPEFFIYDNRQYKMVAKDYQISTSLDFGSPLSTEGEVEFLDYECVENSDLIISVGRVVRTKKRADVVAKVCSLEDIRLN